MTQRAAGRGKRAPALITPSLVLAASLVAAGCVSNSGLLVIVQNQQPVADDTTHVCASPSIATGSPLGSGVLDLEVGAAPPYNAYLLLQSSLPPRAATAGAVEPNAVSIDGVRGTLYPPPGLTVNWPIDCPANFYWPSTATLQPSTSLGLTAQIVSSCQAQAIHDLFASGDLPSEFTQRVMFTIEMRAVGRLMGGGEITSDAFRFSVRMCIGCLQTGFPDIAQYNFPARPSCGAAPKPNLYHGDACNVAQDYGPLLCCTGTMNQIICPAPDM